MRHPSAYDDIINLPYPASSSRPRMSMADRAAQFSPFAALTGHSAAIRETARVTQAQTELTEDARAMLDEKLRMLMGLLPSKPEAAITWFEPDARKAGGAYREAAGCIEKIDLHRRAIQLTSGIAIPMERIVEIECPACRHAEPGWMDAEMGKGEAQPD